jgi:hypothetical protein
VYASVLQRLGSIPVSHTSKNISVLRSTTLTLYHSLTMWYPKYKYQYRVAMFSAAATMAGNARTPVFVVEMLTCTLRRGLGIFVISPQSYGWCRWSRSMVLDFRRFPL